MKVTVHAIFWDNKQGILEPYAVFDPVQTERGEIYTAPLYDLTYMAHIHVEGTKDHTSQIRMECKAELSEEGEIISIDGNITKPLFILPEKCPDCGNKTDIRSRNRRTILVCEYCADKNRKEF